MKIAVVSKFLFIIVSFSTNKTFEALFQLSLLVKYGFHLSQKRLMSVFGSKLFMYLLLIFVFNVSTIRRSFLKLLLSM